MNTEEIKTWSEIIEQCKSDGFSIINVASAKRRNVLIKVDAQLTLVQPAIDAAKEKPCDYENCYIAPVIAEAVKAETERYKRAMILTLPPKYLRKVVQSLDSKDGG
jgi:hypothetical protein